MLKVLKEISIIILFFLCISPFLYSDYKKARLLKTGVRIDGSVVNVNQTIFAVGTTMLKPIVEVTIEVDDLIFKEKSITIKQEFYKEQIPKVGDTVKVVLNDKNRSKSRIIFE